MDSYRIDTRTLAPQASCRDKGWGRADEGALCLSSSSSRHWASHHKFPPNRVATRTSTRPPLILTSTPCPYRMGTGLVLCLVLFALLFTACSGGGSGSATPTPRATSSSSGAGAATPTAS